MATCLFHSFVPSDPFSMSSHLYIIISKAIEAHLQTVQVVEGSDSGQKPDIDDVASTDSDGPVETHVSNPP